MNEEFECEKCEKVDEEHGNLTDYGFLCFECCLNCGWGI